MMFVCLYNKESTDQSEKPAVTEEKESSNP